MRPDVLLVDDDPDHIELCTLALEACCDRSRIASARDVEAALLQLRTLAPLDLPRLVLLDLKLGHQSGLDLLRQVRADHALRHLPVVVHSSSCETRDLDAAYAMGATGYVVKRTTFRALCSSLEALYRAWVLPVQAPVSSPAPL